MGWHIRKIKDRFDVKIFNIYPEDIRKPLKDLLGGGVQKMT